MADGPPFGAMSASRSTIPPAAPGTSPGGEFGGDAGTPVRGEPGRPGTAEGVRRGRPSGDEPGADGRHATTCYMCACRCGIRVTVEDGDVRYIDGNPDHPVNRGVLCAKGNAGIMKQRSPAKLTQPLLRRAGTERGAGQFEPISWERALTMLVKRLGDIRATDPNRLAFFTGRDQMQALSGFWATQFGTLNWAAHGGFCSVNMAAGGLYSVGQSFWEFGEPDWERAGFFLLWGVAEDHSSNPMKLGLERLKSRGAKFVAINPVQTGYQGLADEWLPIRPGTDGLLALSFVHVLLKSGRIDATFLAEATNSAQLVVTAPDADDHGLLLRGVDGEPLALSMATGGVRRWAELVADPDDEPALFGELGPGAWPERDVRATTVMSLAAARYLDDGYAPASIGPRCGIEPATIERLALEMAQVAFESDVFVDEPWTDWTGRKHSGFAGRPVAMHAMRGVSAHANGFQSCRAIHLLQMLLGAIDAPGSHLAKPPFPKHPAPRVRPASETAPDTPLSSPPLGFPTGPEDLVIDAAGRPKRIDHAYSWEAPLAAHGLMHTVIRNAVEADPYPIDTLMLFMANMGWNSSMDTAGVREALKARRPDGEHRIPFVVTSDAFHSEMVELSDLVLPDTTYLERHDTISLLDRPISTPHSVADAIRRPVLVPDRDVRPWQEVLLELGARLGFPALVDGEGAPRYAGYEDFIVRFEKAPGIGFLGGFRGEAGDESLVGAPNPDQWRSYADNDCFFEHPLPANQRFRRHVNRDYLEWARKVGFTDRDGPIVMEVYSETLRRFELAAEGRGPGPYPPEGADRERLKTYFSPLPDWYPALEDEGAGDAVGGKGFAFHAVTQRPMFMYHSWDSQNAWLRQIMASNFLYLNRARGEALGIEDLSWVRVTSRHGWIRCRAKLMEGCNPDTVWTWNAIGKQRGTWGLDPDAPEGTEGFLMNLLIAELLPRAAGERPLSNSDPVTGQAAWYDLRVDVAPAPAGETGLYPAFDVAAPLPGAPRPVTLPNPWGRAPGPVPGNAATRGATESPR